MKNKYKILLWLALVFIPFYGNAQPANNDCASATSLTVGAACVNGTTASATSQAGEVTPSCGVVSQSVWYSFTAASTDMTIITQKNSGACLGRLAVYSGGCLPGAGSELACISLSSAAPNTNPVNLTGLTVGQTYLIRLSYANGGPCGASMTFCIRVECTGGICPPAHCTNGVQDADETGIDCGGVDCAPCASGTFDNTSDCLNNDDCSTAFNLDPFMMEPATNTVIDGDTLAVCGMDCNINAGDESFVINGSCPTIDYNQMVWYTFTATNSLMDLTITTDGFTPSVGIWSGCTGIYGCVEDGTGNTFSVTQFALNPGETYSISVSSDDDGAAGDGNFQICLTDYDLDLLCNLSNSISFTPPPVVSSLIPGGTWAPGTTVEFCYTVDLWDNSALGGCQWLHGIVPSFGGCFDPTTLTPTQAPVEATGNGDGTWAWTTTAVTHNTQSYTVNPNGGWFFTNSVVAGWGDGCPGEDWSHFGCNTGCDVTVYSTYSWTACFEVTTWDTEAECLSNSNDCSVEFKTFADGETGSYTNGYCESDPATSSGNQVACCDASPPGMLGVISAATSLFNSAGTTFTIDLDEPILCGNLSASDFSLGTTGWPLGGATITSVSANDCTSGTDTTMSLTVTVSAAPGDGYDDSWYIIASGTSDVTDVCGNKMTTAASGSVTILPVELLLFDARYNGRDVDLQWVTASEINSAYFYIQRSTDGENFTTFLVKQAAGNSVETLIYDGVDRYPAPGTMFYRLIQVDYDGKYAQSNVVAVNIGSGIIDLFVYPNPVKDQLSLEIAYYESSNGKIKIYNSIGALVREKDVRFIRGTNRENMDITMLNKGIYFVEISVGDNVKRERFIKE